MDYHPSAYVAEVESFFVYKILCPQSWQESQSLGFIKRSEADGDFIHLCEKNQLDDVINKFWHYRSIVILKLLPSKLQGRLVKETNPGSQAAYYHLYDGKIPLDSVTEITVLD